MITVRPLAQLDPDALRRLASGYTAAEKYTVSWTESAERVTFELVLAPLAEPLRKRYDHLDEETLARYQAAVETGYSFGAYAGQVCVGLLLAEPQAWNRSLWVLEIHVAESHRRQGIGRRLIETLADKASAAGLRVLVCETQSSNVPAIRFYRSVGFALEGIDLSHYSNDDYPDGEVAVFMKRKLGP